MIVRSLGTVQALTSKNPTWGYSAGSVPMYGTGHAQTYATIYRTQPNIRICVEFLARNFAQLGLHVFRRSSDTDRVRLADHELANWLDHPNPATTQYRLFESLMQDMGVYYNAYWLKVRVEDGLALIRLPPDQMTVHGGLLPTEFIWTVDGQERDFAPSEIVHFSGYNPDNPLMGLSPMETLREVLAEQRAASDYRRSYWTHGSRWEGVLTVAKDSEAAKWTPKQKQDFRAAIQEFASSGSRAGQFPVLPPGLDIKSTSFNAKDSQYLDSVKLGREICAASYHIPQPLVGILDHATFSNVKEQHKHLYQDCLGPWLKNIAQEIKRQLLVECVDQERVYLEFNIAEKLAGTPEEQINTLVTATGRPIMTGNEARARMNLPRIDDPEMDKVAPQQGGPSDATARREQAAEQSSEPDEAAA